MFQCTRETLSFVVTKICPSDEAADKFTSLLSERKLMKMRLLNRRVKRWLYRSAVLFLAHPFSECDAL